ncbi:MAG TPA: hypothetical protein DEG43_06865 [Acidimicrobiaceae bacterium]|nr:hypothetical protein [Acidimicrobiaceae bacterium]
MTSHAYGLQYGDHNTQFNFYGTGTPLAPRVAEYRSQWLSLVPERLQDRETDLARLKESASSSLRGRWTWMEGGPWSGKTALLATFAQHPPLGIEVAAFFVLSRDSSSNSRESFLARMIPQLAIVAGYSHFLIPQDPIDRLDTFRLLIDEAANSCAARSTFLVILVDGIDEDIAAGAPLFVRGTVGSIASTLPEKVSENVHVVVSTRPSPPPPADLPRDHPLLRSDPWLLSPSPFASALREAALADLRSLTPDGKEVAATLAASGGALTVADLAEILGRDSETIRGVLEQRPARSFIPVTKGFTPDLTTFRIGHDQLDETLMHVLSARIAGVSVDDRLAWSRERRVILQPYRERILRWASTWAERGWPASTPQFLTSDSYIVVLAEEGSIRLLVASLASPSRWEMMRRRFGLDDVGIRQLDLAAEMLVSNAAPQTGDTPQELDLPLLALILTALDEISRALRSDARTIADAAIYIGEVGLVRFAVGLLRDPQSLTETLLNAGLAIRATNTEASHEFVMGAVKSAVQIELPAKRGELLIAAAFAMLDAGYTASVIPVLSDARFALGETREPDLAAQLADRLALGFLAAGEVETASACSMSLATNPGVTSVPGIGRSEIRPRHGTVSSFGGETYPTYAAIPQGSYVAKTIELIAHHSSRLMLEEGTPRIVTQVALLTGVGAEAAARALLKDLMDAVAESDQQSRDSSFEDMRWSPPKRERLEFLRASLFQDGLSAPDSAFGLRLLVASAQRELARLSTLLETVTVSGNLDEDLAVDGLMHKWTEINASEPESMARVLEAWRVACDSLPCGRRLDIRRAHLAQALRASGEHAEAVHFAAKIDDHRLRQRCLGVSLTDAARRSVQSGIEAFPPWDHRLWAEYHLLRHQVGWGVRPAVDGLPGGPDLWRHIEEWRNWAENSSSQPLRIARLASIARWQLESGLDAELDMEDVRQGLQEFVTSIPIVSTSPSDLLGQGLERLNHFDLRRGITEHLSGSDDGLLKIIASKSSKLREAMHLGRRVSFRAPSGPMFRRSSPVDAGEIAVHFDRARREPDPLLRYRELTLVAGDACATGSTEIAAPIVAARANAALALASHEQRGALIQMWPQVMWAQLYADALRIARSISDDSLLRQVVMAHLSEGQLGAAMRAADHISSNAERSSALVDIMISTNADDHGFAIRNASSIPHASERVRYLLTLARFSWENGERNWARIELGRAWIEARHPFDGWAELCAYDPEAMVAVLRSIEEVGRVR